MAELFFHIMRHEPADPVLFLPLADRADSVPVRITDIEIDDGKLMLAVVPLSPAERARAAGSYPGGIEIVCYWRG